MADKIEIEVDVKLVIWTDRQRTSNSSDNR